MSLVARILPPGILGAEILDRGQVVPLHTDEDALVATAGEKRRRDFALGRACARAALGLPDAVIGRGEDGRPHWPCGFTGSITHTLGYAAALAARTSDYVSLGVDAERVGGVAEALIPRLFDEEERSWLAGQGPIERPAMAAMLFSAKEACFKASDAGRVLAFRSIHIEVLDDGLVARQTGFGDLEGRFAIGSALVLTAFWRR